MSESKDLPLAELKISAAGWLKTHIADVENFLSKHRGEQFGTTYYYGVMSKAAIQLEAFADLLLRSLGNSVELPARMTLGPTFAELLKSLEQRGRAVTDADRTMLASLLKIRNAFMHSRLDVTSRAGLEQVLAFMRNVLAFTESDHVRYILGTNA